MEAETVALRPLRLLLVVSLTLCVHGNPSSQTHSLDTSTYHFQLANDAHIKFDADTIYFGDSVGLWNWTDSNAITFYNLRIGDSECPSTWHIKLDNQANITISKLFEDDTFEATVTADTGTTTTVEVYVGNKGEPASVDVNDREARYSYSSSAQTVTVTVPHTSSSTLELLWSAALAAQKAAYKVMYRSLALFGLFVLVLIAAVVVIVNSSSISEHVREWIR